MTIPPSQPAGPVPRWTSTFAFTLLLTAAPLAPRALAGGGGCGDGFCEPQVESCETCPADCCGSPGAYLCYDAQTAKGTPAFTPVPDVHIVDAYEDLRFTVTQVREVCNPASRDEGVPETPTHMTRYEITVPKRTPRNLPKRAVVVNEFGRLTLDAITGDKLLVPAAKSLAGPPQPLVSPDLDHFKCYDVKVSKGTAKFAKGIRLDLVDQFRSTPVAWDVVGPAHLCPVAQKNGEPVLDPCAALVCYDVKPAKGSAKFKKVKPVYTRDQFGGLTLEVIDKDEVCVASTITDGETPVCLPTTSTTSTSTTSSTSTSSSSTSSSSSSSSTSSTSSSSSSSSSSTSSSTSTSSTSTTSTTEAFADLSLTKTIDPDVIHVNQQVTYTVTLHNAGPSTATGVQVMDLVTDPALAVSSSSADTGTYDQTSGLWSVDTLASGADASLQIVVDVSGCNAVGSTHTNTAEVVAADQTDPDSIPNDHDGTEDDQAIASLLFSCD